MLDKKQEEKSSPKTRLIEEFEVYLAKPVIEEELQSFGDEYDSLKTKFDSWQKEVKGKLFREHLLDIMNKKSVAKNSDVYKAAGISKYVFHDIMNFKQNPPHKPSKNTVAALSIGLMLDIDEAEEFYNNAGYHLGNTEFVDKVIRFFISQKNYKIQDVSECLHYYGYQPLGDNMREEKKYKHKKKHKMENS